MAKNDPIKEATAGLNALTGEPVPTRSNWFSRTFLGGVTDDDVLDELEAQQQRLEGQASRVNDAVKAEHDKIDEKAKTAQTTLEEETRRNKAAIEEAQKNSPRYQREQKKKARAKWWKEKGKPQARAGAAGAGLVLGSWLGKSIYDWGADSAAGVYSETGLPFLPEHVDQAVDAAMAGTPVEELPAPVQKAIPAAQAIAAQQPDLFTEDELAVLAVDGAAGAGIAEDGSVLPAPTHSRPETPQHATGSVLAGLVGEGQEDEIASAKLTRDGRFSAHANAAYEAGEIAKLAAEGDPAAQYVLEMMTGQRPFDVNTAIIELGDSLPPEMVRTLQDVGELFAPEDIRDLVADAYQPDAAPIETAGLDATPGIDQRYKLGLVDPAGGGSGLLQNIATFGNAPEGGGQDVSPAAVEAYAEHNAVAKDLRALVEAAEAGAPNAVDALERLSRGEKITINELDKESRYMEPFVTASRAAELFTPQELETILAPTGVGSEVLAPEVGDMPAGIVEDDLAIEASGMPVPGTGSPGIGVPDPVLQATGGLPAPPVDPTLPAEPPVPGEPTQALDMTPQEFATLMGQGSGTLYGSEGEDALGGTLFPGMSPEGNLLAALEPFGERASQAILSMGDEVDLNSPALQNAIYHAGTFVDRLASAGLTPEQIDTAMEHALPMLVSAGGGAWAGQKAGSVLGMPGRVLGGIGGAVGGGMFVEGLVNDAMNWGLVNGLNMSPEQAEDTMRAIGTGTTAAAVAAGGVKMLPSGSRTAADRVAARNAAIDAAGGRAKKSLGRRALGFGAKRVLPGLAAWEGMNVLSDYSRGQAMDELLPELTGDSDFMRQWEQVYLENGPTAADQFAQAYLTGEAPPLPQEPEVTVAPEPAPATTEAPAEVSPLTPEPQPEGSPEAPEAAATPEETPDPNSGKTSTEATAELIDTAAGSDVTVVGTGSTESNEGGLPDVAPTPVPAGGLQEEYERQARVLESTLSTSGASSFSSKAPPVSAESEDPALRGNTALEDAQVSAAQAANDAVASGVEQRSNSSGPWQGIKEYLGLDNAEGRYRFGTALSKFGGALATTPGDFLEGLNRGLSAATGSFEEYDQDMLDRAETIRQEEAIDRRHHETIEAQMKAIERRGMYNLAAAKASGDALGMKRVQAAAEYELMMLNTLRETGYVEPAARALAVQIARERGILTEDQDFNDLEPMIFPEGETAPSEAGAAWDALADAYTIYAERAVTSGMSGVNMGYSDTQAAGLGYN